MEHGFLFQAAIYLAAAVVAVPLFKRLGLGAVLGYLAAGSALGPWGLGFVKDSTHTLEFAELGVVLLLFLIGIELRPRRLWYMRYAVFVMGGAQVLLTTCALALIASRYLSLTASFIVGFSLSLSSTAFALQLLAERKDLNTAYGRTSFAVLLFQDLIAIPVLALIPFLAPSHDTTQGFSYYGFTKALFAIVAVIFGGRYAIRPFFRAVSSADSREVFSAAALLLVLGVGLLMESIGLSMALGAFLAGVLLSDSEYRHVLEADIEPFKGLLLGLFFIAVGTSVDYGLIFEHPGPMAGALALLLLVKYGVVFSLGRLAKLTPEGSRKMASVLPQGGEFAFVIFGVAVSNQILPAEVAKVLVVVVIASMVATPILGIIDRTLFARLTRPKEEPFDKIEDEHNPIIVAGFGRVGQMIGRILTLQEIGFTTLDNDSEQVNAVRKFGARVYYGDASRLDLLEAAGAKSAKYFVLAIDDVETSVRTAALVRKHFPHLKILARARNRQHAFELLDLGVTKFWRETLGSSLEMAEGLLLEMGTSATETQAIIARFRKHDESTLLKQHGLHGDEKAVIQYSKQATQQLLDSVAADRRNAV